VKRIVVVGGSAGGIRAFCTLLKALPQKFAAPVLGVIHISEEANSLAEVIQRCTRLKIVDLKTPQAIRAGKVYVAPANRHLIVKSGCAVAVMGPRENRHRPAIDTLFRSAARAYRNSVIAVVLSGALDDGSAGALAVKARGGTVVVQEPDDAEVPDMPANVLRQVKTDHCAKLEQIPSILKRLVSQNGKMDLPERGESDCEVNIDGFPAAENEPIAFTCPECGGALLQVEDGKTVQWRCHVGHRFSLSSFSEAHADAVERAIWVALRKLKERTAINNHLTHVPTTSPQLRKRFQENSAAAEHDIKLLEEILTRL
jgi:two-component system, chemotaxis family, protein-glutamate methylesterase/glutaminase